MRQDRPGPQFEGLRVIEVADGFAGPLAGRMFAAQGADVVKVEPPRLGDRLRRYGPSSLPASAAGTSGFFHYLNMSKRSVTIEIEQDEGAALLSRLLEKADVLIDGTPYGHLDQVFGGGNERADRFSKLVHVSVTPFGRSGPYRDFLATELTLHALSGEMSMAGHPDKAPLLKGGRFAQFHGGMHAFIAALAALHARRRTARGQHVDVSISEGWSSTAGSPLKKQSFSKEPPRRSAVSRARGEFPGPLRRCKDGWILVGGRGGRRDWWPAFVRLLGRPELEDAALRTAEGRQERAAMLERTFSEWLMERPGRQVYEEAQSAGLAAAYVVAPNDVQQSPQLRARNFLTETEMPGGGSFPIASRPWMAGRLEWSNGKSPRLGEHNEEVLVDELGVPPDEMDRLARQGVT